MHPVQRAASQVLRLAFLRRGLDPLHQHVLGQSLDGPAIQFHDQSADRREFRLDHGARPFPEQCCMGWGPGKHRHGMPCAPVVPGQVNGQAWMNAVLGTRQMNAAQSQTGKPVQIGIRA